MARGRGLPTLLDSLGEGLKQGAAAATRIIKVNLAAANTVEAINSIGAGDAMTAGMRAGLVCGLPPVECFRLGMAAAAANTLTWEACRFDLADVETLLPRIVPIPF